MSIPKIKVITRKSNYIENNGLTNVDRENL